MLIMCIICLIAGMPTEDNDQIQAAAQKLRDQGVELVIAKLGTKGSLLIQKDQVVQQGIVKADKVSCPTRYMQHGPLSSRAVKLCNKRTTSQQSRCCCC